VVDEEPGAPGRCRASLEGDVEVTVPGLGGMAEEAVCEALRLQLFFLPQVVERCARPPPPAPARSLNLGRDWPAPARCGPRAACARARAGRGREVEGVHVCLCRGYACAFVAGCYPYRVLCAPRSWRLQPALQPEHRVHGRVAAAEPRVMHVEVDW